MRFQPPPGPCCLILGNGEYPDIQILKSINDLADYTICSDGGANIAREFKILPDIIIGDMDSISDDSRQYFSEQNVNVKQIPSQANNDLEKAIDHAMNTHRYETIILLGFLGLREDHSFATLQVVEKNCLKTRFQLYSKSSEYLILPAGEYQFTIPKNQLISAFPFPEVTQLVSTGLLWNFHADTFHKGSRGVSNVITNSEITISFKTGNLLLILPD